MYRTWLIARREIVAYAGAPSFWLALLMGPLLMLLAALGFGALARAPSAPPARVIALAAPDAELAAAMKHALEEAADLGGERVRVVVGDDKAAASRLRLTEDAAGGKLSLDGERLSKLSLALLRRDVATALRERAAPAVGSAAATLRVQVTEPPPRIPQPQDTGRFARFSMCAALWLALVGSLGMLLQAVVRERTSRALESLLSAARPSEIVVGKLVGVGALATLVIGVWLVGGAAVAASPLVAKSPVAALALQSFSDVRSVLFGGAVFVMAYVMYGSAVIGLGALARDTASAQNLSRPVFATLLAVFFVAVGQVAGMGAAALPTLSLLPPFAPFALILAGPKTIEGWRLVVSLGGIVLSILLSLWLAAQALRGERPGFVRRRPV